MQRCSRVWATETAIKLGVGSAALMLTAVLFGAEAQSPERSLADVSWESAQTVTVTMINYEFIPDRLVFRRGVPYRVHLENNGSGVRSTSRHRNE
jgi:hypothetical protein